jgi:lysyl-tRNA synthetase, class II
MKETFIPKSTNLSEVTYDSDAQEMEITFQDGASYLYHNVPVGVFIGIQHAPSPGKYFYQNIRNYYAYEEV